MDNLIGLIAWISLLLTLLIMLFFCVLFQLIVNKKTHDFIETLNEHDKAVIVSYKKASTLNIKDLKRKK